MHVSRICSRAAVNGAALLVLGIPAVALGAMPAQAAASTTTVSETIPLQPDPYVTYGCNGEVITLTGSVHNVFHITTDAGGALHVHATSSFQDVSGVSDTGVRYRAVEAGSGGFNVDFGGGVNEATTIDNYRLIGQGQAPDQVLRVVFHVTATPNGNVSASVDNITEECRQTGA